MKKIICAIAASSVMMMSSAAVATSPVYSPSLPWNFNGIVSVFKGVPLSCEVNVDIDSAGATITLTPNPASPGGYNALCSSVIPNHVPTADIDYNATTKNLTFKNVFIQTITAGDCQGDIVGNWNVGSQTLTVSGSMPAATAGAACTMSGVLDLMSPTPGSIS